MKKLNKKYSLIGLFLSINFGLLVANITLLANQKVNLSYKINLDNLLNSIVEIKIKKNEQNFYATGFVLDNMIITNKHILDDADKTDIFYRFANQKDYTKSKIINISKKYDILSLELKSKSKNLELETNFNYGEEIFTIGNPHNLGLTINKGIVSGTNKLENEGIFVRSNITIEPGNSGGPVLNSKNKVIGIMTSRLVNEKPVQGISFFIPSNQIKEFLNSN